MAKVALSILLKSEHDPLRISCITEGRRLWSFEILWPSINIFADEAGNGSICIERHDREPTSCQQPTQRYRELDKIIHAATIGKVRDRYEAVLPTQSKDERVSASLGLT